MAFSFWTLSKFLGKKKTNKKNQAYFGGLNLFDADEIVKEEVKLIRHKDLLCINVAAASSLH